MILIGIFDLLIYPLIDSKCLSVVMVVNFAIANYQRRKKKSSYCLQNKWTFALRRDMLPLDVGLRNGTQHLIITLRSIHLFG